MLNDESPRPSEQEIASWRMKWQDLHGPKPTRQQMLLDELTATFMLSGFGRPEELYGGINPWLDERKFNNLNNSRENHLYLSLIAQKLLDDRDPCILEIGQIMELISDLDIITRYRPILHPYRGDFEGVYKFYHSDFDPLRKSLQTYWNTVRSDPGGLGKRVDEAVQNRVTRLNGKMMEAQFVVDRMAHIVNLDYRSI
jgi:hypothetical protein